MNTGKGIKTRKDINTMKTEKNKILHINKAKGEDALQIIEYLNIVGGESDNLLFGANGFSMTVEAEEGFIEKLADAKASALFTGKIGDEIVCVGSVMAEERERIAHQAELAISVKKKYWGQGIGTRLMDTMIAFSRENGQTEILHLGVRAENENAVKLYKKKGFIEVGRHKNFFKIDGKYHDEILMDLYL